VPISVTENPPDVGTLVLKRFDPRKLSISMANKEIELILCIEEIRILRPKIDMAFSKLLGPKLDLWSR
jgi:hypothetical protein